LKQFLDDTCRKLNDDWTNRSAEITSQAIEIDAAMDACREVFQGRAFRRYSSAGYENRFNRAIFDVQMLFLTRPDIRSSIVEQAGPVREAFEELSLKRSFVDATASTTKSISATFTRLSLWASSLHDLTGGLSPKVRLAGNRIQIVE
ncbi:MAG: hypothetical protein ACREXR_20035, partial [Gammaproteobacteria bacterium]